MANAVETMFSMREKPWHYEMTKEVTKIIQEAPTSYDALVAAGLNWEVESKKIQLAETGIEIPNAWANVRNTDGKVLGIVTDRYKIVQNVDAFSFTDTLIGGEVRYETAGSLLGGRKIWLLAQMPKTTVLGDDVEPYLCFTNTHDGSGAVRVMMTPVRVVCNNTLNLALRTAKRSWSVKHTGDPAKKIAEARETLGLANEYMSSLNEQAEKFTEVKVDEATVEAMLKNLFPVGEKASDTVKRNAQANKDAFIMCYAAPDIAQYYGTAWGVINAAADMVAHAQPHKNTATYDENRWNQIMNGHALVDSVTKMFA